MRLIDAEPLEEILRLRCAQCSNDYGSLAGAISGCLKLLQAQPVIAPSNGPLTLDELREMSGEPVWIVGADDDAIEGNGYAIVEFARSDLPQVWWFGNEVEMMPLIENYGKTWLAYRRKPEETM